MNKVFRVIWSHATQTWTVVSELTRAHGKTKSKNIRKLSALALATGGLLISTEAFAEVWDGGKGGGFGSFAIGNDNGMGGLTIGMDGWKASVNSNDWGNSVQATAVGIFANATNNSTALGSGAGAYSSGTGNVTIGPWAMAGAKNDLTVSVGGAIGDAFGGDVSLAAATGSDANGWSAGGQSIAIGGGNYDKDKKKFNRTIAYGGQSIALGSDVLAYGASSVAIGGDDTGVADDKSVTYTNPVDGKSTSGTIGKAFKALTGNDLNTLNTDGTWVYSKTFSGNIAVAIGPRAQAGDISVALGAKAEAVKVNSVALGTGASATFDNSVAIGGGSTTKNSAGTKETRSQVGNIVVDWAGGENILEGDVVSFGQVGFERQLKNVAAGKISNTSTDAVNGSQLYALASVVSNIVGDQEGLIVYTNAAKDPLTKVNGKFYKREDVNTDGTLKQYKGGTKGAKNTTGDTSEYANLMHVVKDSQGRDVWYLAKDMDPNTGLPLSTASDGMTQVTNSDGSKQWKYVNKATGALGGDVAADDIPKELNYQSEQAVALSLVNGTVSSDRTKTPYTLTNIANGVNDNDAVNVSQLRTAIQNAEIYNYAHVNDGSNNTTAKNGTNANATQNKASVGGAGGATGTNSVAIGVSAQAQGNYSLALGDGAQASIANSVALGNFSTTSAAVATANGSVNGAVIGTISYTGYAGATPYSVLSIGQTGKDRQIQNVAAGRVSSTSTDAINGSQLFAVMDKPTTFSGNSGTTDRKLGEGLKIYGDGTDLTSTADNSGIKFALAKTAAVTKNDAKVVTSGAVYTAIQDAVATTTLSQHTDGSMKLTTAGEGSKLMTADNIKNAINLAAWKLTTEAVTAEGGSVTSSSTAMVQPGYTVKMQAGKNIALTQKDNGRTIKVATADAVNFTSVTLPATTGQAQNVVINNTGMTITPTTGATAANTVSVTKDGISAGSNAISNVAAQTLTTGGTYAATTGQVHTVSNDLTTLKAHTIQLTGNTNKNGNTDNADGGTSKKALSTNNISFGIKGKSTPGTGGAAATQYITTNANGDDVEIDLSEDAKNKLDNANKAASNTLKLTAVAATGGTNSSTSGQALNKTGGLEFKFASADNSLLTVSATGDTVTLTPVKSTISYDTTNKTFTKDKEGLTTGSNVVDMLNKVGAIAANNANLLIQADNKAGANLVTGKVNIGTETLSIKGAGLATTAVDATDGNTITVTVDESAVKNAAKEAAQSAVIVEHDNAQDVVKVSTKPEATDDPNKTTYVVTYDGANAAAKTDLTYNIKNGSTTGTAKTTKLNTGLTFEGGTNITTEFGNNGVVKFNAVTGEIEADTGANAGKVKAKTTAATGSAAVSSDAGKLVTAGEVVDAVNTAYWKVKAEAESSTVGKVTGTSESKAMSAGDEMKLIAGKNVNINQNGRNFTFSLATDGLDLSNKSITNVKDNLTVINNPTAAKPNDGTSGSLPTPAPNGNNAATVNDVLNAGWNLQGNGTAVDFVKTYDTVDFVNGKGTAVSVTRDATSGKNTIKVDMTGDLSDVTNLVVGKEGTKGADGTYTGGKDGKVTVNGKDGESVVINGKDGTIGANGANGAGVTINGKDGSIGLKGENGANGLTIKGADGKPGLDGTSNTTRIEYTTTGGTTEQVATLNDGQKYVGDDGTEEVTENGAKVTKEVAGKVVKRKLNQRLQLKGGADTTKLSDNNIGVVYNDEGSLAVKLAKELSGLTSATFNVVDSTGATPVTTKTTVVDGNGIIITKKAVAPATADTIVSLTDAGLSNGGNKITGVATGTADTDAVNVEQLKDTVAKAELKVTTDKEIDDPSSTAATPPKVKATGKVALGSQTLNIVGGGIAKTSVDQDGQTVTVTVNADDVAAGTKLKYKANSTNTASEIHDVALGDGLDFVNGTYTTASTEAAGKVKFDVNVFDNANLTNTNGKLSAATANTDGKVMNAADVIKAVNEAGWMADVDGNIVKAKDATTNADIEPAATKVAAGNKVTFNAGKNVTIKQEIATNGDHTYTFALKDGIDGGNQHITNVKDNLTVVNNPDGTEAKKDEGKSGTAPTNPAGNNAATVSDVLNAGWNLQGNGEAVDFVKPYDTVNFADGKGTKAKVERDAHGVNTIKVDVDMSDYGQLDIGKKGADGKDGSIAVNGKDGSGVVINGKDGSIGLNGTDGKNGLTIKGDAGVAGVDGKDGEQITRIVYEHEVTKDDGTKEKVTETVATLNDGLKFAGDDGATTVIKKKLNEKLEIVGGADSTKLSDNNIGVNSDNGKLAVKLAKELAGLTSATFNVVDPTTKDVTGTTVVNGSNITISDKEGNINSSSVVGNTIVDKDGNTNTSTADGSIITDTDGNLNVVTAAINTLSDKAGNATVVSSGGVTITTPESSTGANDGKLVSLTENGLNNGGNKIINVADATDASDAINKKQLDELGAKTIKLTAVAATGGTNTTTDAQQLKDGINFNIASSNNDVLTVTAAGSTITLNPQTANLVKAGDTTVTSADANKATVASADEKKLVTAKNVVDAINSVSWNVSGKKATTDGGEFTDETAGADDAAKAANKTVKAGDTVNYIAGKNMKIVQNGRDFTFAMTDTIALNEIKFTKGDNTVTVNGDGLVSKDKDGNSTTVTTNGTVIADKDGNINSSSSTGNNLADADGNTHINTADSNMLSDKAGNTTVVNAGGITITTPSKTETDSSGNTVVVEPGKQVILNKDGLDNGGNTITNVGDAVNDTDAVNKGQLDKAAAASKTTVTVNNKGAGTANLVLTPTTDANDGHTNYDVKLADKVVLGKDTDGEVTLDGTTGKVTAKDIVATNTITAGTGENAVTIDGANANVKVGDGDNAIDLDGKEATITVGLGSDNAVVIDGKEGKVSVGDNIVLDNAKKSATIGGITVDGENNHITGLSNKDWTPGVTEAVDGRAATENQLKAVDNALQNLKNTGLNFDTNEGGISKALGETVVIKGEGTKTNDHYSAQNIKTKVDDDGNIIVMMDKELRSDKLVIGPEGKDSVVIHAGNNGEGSITVNGKDGNPVVDIGSDTNGNGSITTNNKNGDEITNIGGDENGNGLITISNKDGNTSASIGTNSDGTGKIVVNGNDGKDAVAIDGKDGKGSITVNGKDGKPSTSITTNDNGSGNIAVNGKDGKDAIAVNGDKETITVGSGDNKVVINGKDGSVGIAGKDGKDAVSITKDADGNGTLVVNDKDGEGVSIRTEKGQNVLQENGTYNKDEQAEHRIVYKAKGKDGKDVTRQVANMDDGLNFAGDNGATTIISKRLNDKLEIVGGADKDKLSDNNIGVNAKDGKLEVKLAKELKDLTSAEFKDAAGNSNMINGAGNTLKDAAGNKVVNNAAGTTIENKAGDKVEIKPNQIVVTRVASAGAPESKLTIEGDKINMGGGTITNVGTPVNPTDAVNKSYVDSQMSKGFSGINERINTVDRDLRAGIAGATALGFIQSPSEPGKASVSVGVGGYRGENAVAIGFGKNSDNNKISVKFGASMNSRKDLNWGGSVGYQW